MIFFVRFTVHGLRCTGTVHGARFTVYGVRERCTGTVHGARFTVYGVRGTGTVYGLGVRV